MIRTALLLISLAALGHAAEHDCTFYANSPNTSFGACCLDFVNSQDAPSSCCSGVNTLKENCSSSSCPSAFGFPNDAEANCNPQSCPSEQCSCVGGQSLHCHGTVVCMNGPGCLNEGLLCLEDGSSINYKVCGGQECEYTWTNSTCHAPCDGDGVIISTGTATKHVGKCPNVTISYPCSGAQCPTCEYETIEQPCNATCDNPNQPGCINYLNHDKNGNTGGNCPDFWGKPSCNCLPNCNSRPNCSGLPLCWDGLPPYEVVTPNPNPLCQCPKRCADYTNIDCPIGQDPPYQMACRYPIVHGFPRVPMPARPKWRCVGIGPFCCQRDGVPFNYPAGICDDGTNGVSCPPL